MSSINRRVFLQTSAKSAVALSLLTVGAARGWAAEKVPPGDPQAAQLGYVEDATTAPERTEAKANQFCHNCNFYAETEPGWGTCQLLANRLVTADGWCKVWVAKP
jgi:hypothetical protein